MSNELPLKSLQIKNFRGIRELKIEKLGRVNLITGKNNVGKSSLLEAIRIYARPGSIDELLDILVARHEIQKTDAVTWRKEGIYPIPLENVFFGRMPYKGGSSEVVIGELDSGTKSLHIRYVETEGVLPSLDGNKDFNILFHTARLLFEADSAMAAFTTEASSELTTKPATIDPELGRSVSNPLRNARKQPSTSIVLQNVDPNGVDRILAPRLWDDISLSAEEDDVLRCLRIISTDIERIAFKEFGFDSSRRLNGSSASDRVPFAKLKGYDKPVPLRSLGDGVSRLFGLSLALVHAQEGFLLVDEIENGLHYSVQYDLWRLIFESAKRLNVQVFAATHSLDCIKAFTQAAAESPDEGCLVRLAIKNGRNLVGEFSEEDLEIAIEGQIEVR